MRLLPFSAPASFRLLPPASVCFRQLPLHLASFRFGPHLVCVTDGHVSGGQDDDVGRSYLETQHAHGPIFGENRPILAMLMPFLLLSASVCIRQLPPSAVGFRHVSLLIRVSGGNVDGARMMISREHIWKPNRTWIKFLAKIDRF